MGVALYRKYRSKSLSEVVGQKHITDVLDLALKKGKIAHAYLFTGPRGVGKTSIARILAHEINNLPYEEESSHPDIIEIDAASNNGVDDIRALRDQVQVAPFSAKYRVYVIDEVHMLSKSAFNALLKTLEEPPEHAVFILATTDAHKLPATIISRTQQFVFHFISKADIVAHLDFISKSEGIKISTDALEIIAERGGGSFRDSISLLDQISSLGENEEISGEKLEQILGLAPKTQIHQLIEYYETQNVGEILAQIENIRNSGVDLRVFTEQFVAEIKNSLTQKPHLIKILKPLQEAKSSNFLELELLSILIAPNDFVLPAPRISSELSSFSSGISVAQRSETRELKERQKFETQKYSRNEASNESTSSKEKEELSKTQENSSKEKMEISKTEKVEGSIKPQKTSKPKGDHHNFKWQDFLRAVKESSPMIGGILAQSGHELSNGTINIYAGFRIKKIQLEKPNARTTMSEALKKIGAGDWLIEIFAKQKPPEDPAAAAVFEIMGGGEEVVVDE